MESDIRRSSLAAFPSNDVTCIHDLELAIEELYVCK